MPIPYLVAIISVLTILGAWLYVQPTPRERQLTRLRQRAIALGLEVQLLIRSSLKDHDQIMALLEDPSQASLYSLACTEKEEEGSADTWLWIHSREGWQLVEGRLENPARQRLADWLNSSFQDSRFYGLQRTPKRIRLLWHEYGDESQVDRIADLLNNAKSL